jgi:hypothetical protein
VGTAIGAELSTGGCADVVVVLDVVVLVVGDAVLAGFGATLSAT